MAGRLIRRFTELLGLCDRGQFEQDCNVALSEAIETLQAQAGAKGKAKLTVELELAFDKGMLQITPALKSKLPESKGYGGTVLWAHEGALSTQHPSQMDIEDAIHRTERAAS